MYVPLKILYHRLEVLWILYQHAELRMWNVQKELLVSRTRPDRAMACLTGDTNTTSIPSI